MNFSVPDRIEKVINKFVDNKSEIYIVGGSVRDLCLERKVKDWDMTTNLTPEQICHLFPKNSFYNNKFGTVGVNIGEEIVEITTFSTKRQDIFSGMVAVKWFFFDRVEGY
jgi:tRNA nucleotidyltransferase/poly(A) polymerase